MTHARSRDEKPFGGADANESDAELFAAMSAGNLTALGVLYDRHHQGVRRFVVRAIRGSRDAEDLVHDIFLTAARVAGTYDDRAGARPFLLGVAANIARSRRQKQARWRSALDLLEHGKAVAEPSSSSPSAPGRTVTTVVPEGEARFVRATDGGTEIVTLESGAVDLSVRHLGAGERFIVKAGDAEVEVRGTVFRVEAADNRLQSVAVVDGKVEVRFRGRAVLLTADERWDRPADAPRISPPTVPVEAPAAAPMRAPRMVATAKGGPASSRPASSASPPPEDGLVEGMGMMERGDYGAASRHLEAFAKSNADDDRAEDAAFLVILALQRAGRDAEMVTAAHRYLGAYPAGYRRAEAQAIADASRADVQ